MYATKRWDSPPDPDRKSAIDEPAAVSVYWFVIAGVPTGVAVKEAVGAEAHGDFGMAEHAVFFAPATRFRPLTLDTDDTT
jgi:hypothetical protein